MTSCDRDLEHTPDVQGVCLGHSPYQKGAFAKESPSTRSMTLWIAALAIFASLIILGGTVWREWVARDVQVRETNAALVNLASSLLQNADDTIELADTVLIGVVERLEADGTSPAAVARLDQLLAARVTALPRVRDFTVLGEDGNWLATSMAAKGSNNADRPYFQHHLNLPKGGLFIGPLIRSRSTGRWTITVSRRFEHGGWPIRRRRRRAD